ncbi:MAG: HesA/MoeB/ThiF family protein [Alphaproteobacteria bacterium]
MNDNQLNRYARHIKLNNVGKAGQEKLLNSKVLVIGAGGLGSPILLYLASSGVGKVGIVDFDTVDESNLQRQVIHSENDIGSAKVNSAKNSINEINSDTVVETFRQRLNADNIQDIFKDYDIIVDGSDNFATRYLVNEYVIKMDKVLVSGALNQFDGQVLSVDKNNPCYQCVFPNQPDANSTTTCESVGVLGTTAGFIGLIQANEVVKIILGIGENLLGKLYMVDTLNNETRILKTQKDKSCKICGS